MTNEPTATQPARKIDYAARDAARTKALRWTADTLCLWGLCANATCRRARQCRSEPHDCLTQYLPLVPEDAREGVKAMAAGLARKMTFDEAYCEWPDTFDAVTAWAELVEGCARNGDRRQR